MTPNRRVEQFHPLGQRHWNVQERLDFPKPHDSHDSIASKNGNIHRFTSTQKPSTTHKFMSHVFPGPLKLLIPRNFLSKAPFHLVQYRIFQCHGANDEVAPWNVTRMESQDYRCNMNDESNDLQLLSGTANKSSIILLKVYTKKTCKKKTLIFVVKLIEISTSKFLHCRLNRRSVNVWQQVIPPSDNLCLCHWKGSVHGVVHRDCLTNKQGCTWKHLETLKIRVFLFLFQHWA